MNSGVCIVPPDSYRDGAGCSIYLKDRAGVVKVCEFSTCSKAYRSWEIGYLKGFDLATANEIWNVATNITYDQICRHLVCVGNSVYAFKYPPSTGGAGSYARIVRYDYSTGNTKDSISIPGESFGKMHLIASDGKTYTTQ